MRLALAAVLALGLTVPALAQKIEAPSGSYAVDPTHASITFRVMHFGLSNYTMRFAKFDSTVELDAANPVNSKLTVKIDPATIRTDFPFPEKVDFDKKLASDEQWLQGKPISFVSRKLVQSGPRTGKLTGDLTIRGVTRPVTLDVTFNGAIQPNQFIKQPTFGISATGAFKRSQFGMDFGGGALGDEITVQIEAEYNKTA